MTVFTKELALKGQNRIISLEASGLGDPSEAELESGPLFRTRPDPNPTIFNPNPTRTRSVYKCRY